MLAEGTFLIVKSLLGGDFFMKRNNIVRIICEIGLFASLGFVLDELQGILGKGLFVNGGSIGFAMITVVIISFRRGIIPGFITGLIIGLFDMATGAFIIHPAQPFLDYILPYALVAVSGIFRNLFIKDKKKTLWLIIAVTCGGLLKFLSHYLAGVLFWGDNTTFAWNLSYMPASLYSLVYNIAFIGPSIILSSILLVLINRASNKILLPQDINDSNESVNKKTYQLSRSIVAMGIGIFLFIFFLIKYIKSYGFEDYGNSFEYSFNKDCMVIWIMGLGLIFTGLFSLICYFKNKDSKIAEITVFSLISFDSLIYAIAMLIRSYKKCKPVSNYWIWFAVSLLLLLVFVFFLIKNIKIKSKKN